MTPRKPKFEGYSSREVPFEGPQPADWLLIGEAPGAQEDETGRPFVGQAGLVLDQCLRAAGLRRDLCRVGNAVPRRPPGNRTPHKKEIAYYRERLAAEIASTQPKVIVALGDTALRALTGMTGITKLRGMEITTPEGWVVLPTYHPAYVLPGRNPAGRQWLIKDLERANRLAGGRPSAPDVRVIIARTAEDLAPLAEAARAAPPPVLAYDIETTGLDPLDPAARIVGIGVAASPTEGYYVLPSAWDALRPILAAPGRRVAHNSLFDNRFLRRNGFKVETTFDTLLAAYILDDTRPTYRLERMAVEMLGVPPYHEETDKALEEGKAADLDPEVLGARCVRDACYTMQLYMLLRKQIMEDPGLVSAFRHLMMPSARLIEDVMDAGLPLNLALLEARIKECDERLEASLAEMRRLAGREDFNPGSPVQVGDVLANVLGVPIFDRTPTGRPATGKTVLARLGDSPFVKALREYRKVGKFRSTYYVRWRDSARNGRVHGRFWIARFDEGSGQMRGTATGRFSGDLQQTPRQYADTPAIYRVKDVVVAPPGFLLVECDLSQIELRVAAWLAPEPEMLAAYQAGRDLHIETARAVLGIENPTKEDRFKAKSVNFGLIYGMGEISFLDYAYTEYGIALTLQQAKEIRKAFFSKYAGLPDYYRRCEREVRRTKKIRTPFGRVRHLPMIDSPIPERANHAVRQAINTPIQATASDLNLLTILAARALAPPGTRLLLPVHDSSLWEVPEAEAESFSRTIVSIVRHRLAEIVREKFGIRPTVPFDAEAKIGRVWGDLRDA